MLATNVSNYISEKCGNNNYSYYPSAYGKVPHVVAERDLHGWGFQRRLARYEILEGTKCCQKGTKGCQKEPKGTQNGAKGRQREPKGTQGAPKGNQGGTKRHPKVGLGARVDFECQNGSIPYTDLDQFLVNFSTKKSIKNRCKNRCRKT